MSTCIVVFKNDMYFRRALVAKCTPSFLEVPNVANSIDSWLSEHKIKVYPLLSTPENYAHNFSAENMVVAFLLLFGFAA
jgi:hypothetical protein